MCSRVLFSASVMSHETRLYVRLKAQLETSQRSVQQAQQDASGAQDAAQQAIAEKRALQGTVEQLQAQLRQQQQQQQQERNQYHRYAGCLLSRSMAPAHHAVMVAVGMARAKTTGLNPQAAPAMLPVRYHRLPLAPSFQQVLPCTSRLRSSLHIANGMTAAAPALSLCVCVCVCG